MPADRWEQGDRAATVAAELAADIRDVEPARVHARVAGIVRRDPLLAQQVIVALAAMVPDDRGTRELLEWTDPLMPARRRYDAERYRRRLEIVPSTPGGQREETA